MLVQACSLNLNISVQSRTIEPAKGIVRAKAPVLCVPTNPSLKAGVSDGLI